jgi:hypothetical protein
MADQAAEEVPEDRHPSGGPGTPWGGHCHLFGVFLAESAASGRLT